MITEDIINETYIKRIVTRDANRIYTTQADVIRQNFDSERTKNLANFLVKKPFSSQYAPGKDTYYFRVFTYLRFLDIRFSGRRSMANVRHNLALYNRVVWGVLYHETLPDLRYGLTQDIHDSIKAELEAAVK